MIPYYRPPPPPNPLENLTRGLRVPSQILCLRSHRSLGVVNLLELVVADIWIRSVAPSVPDLTDVDSTKRNVVPRMLNRGVPGADVITSTVLP